MEKTESDSENYESVCLDLTKYNRNMFEFGNEIGKDGILVLSNRNSEELEKIRVELISKCLFEESKVVNNYKLLIIKQEESRQAEIYEMFFEFSVQKAKETYDEHFTAIQQKYLNAEVKIRKKISDKFHQTQVEHIEALAESEKEFIVRNTKLALKSSKKVKDLVKSANLSAKFGYYLKAHDLALQASDAQQRARYDNKSSVSSDFMNVRKAMLRHQKMEIQELTAKLKTELSQMFSQMDDEVERLNVVYIKEVGLAQTNAKKNAIQKATNKRVRDMALEMISVKYKEELEEFHYQESQKKK